MSLRAATPDDAAPIARLHFQGSLLTTHSGVLDPEVRARLQRDQAAMWDELLARPPAGQRAFVIDDGDVVGFTSAGPDPDNGGARGRVFALFVEPASWGSGLGARLLEAAEQHLCAHSRDASLWVLDGNARARRLYERCGWREAIGTGKRRYGRRFVLYRKRIAVIHEIRLRQAAAVRSGLDLRQPRRPWIEGA